MSNDSAPLQVQEWELAKLRPYPNNPRKNEPALHRMVGALEEFGFRIPILIKSDGTIIDGHLRARAAEAKGMSTIPVIVADDLTEAQVHAFRLLANKSVSWAEWDEELLRRELQLIGELGVDDLTVTGFDDKELAKLLSEDVTVTLEPVEVAPFPHYTWALVGIPTGRYIEIAEHIEAISLTPDVFVELTANEQKPPAKKANV